MEQKKKLLLIDDELDNLEMLAMLLKSEGYELFTAIDGYDGIKKLQVEKFDIVVCDYFMPKMDGIAMLTKVRQAKDYTPFIFFSGNANEKHEVSIIGLGAYEVVHKPDVDHLLEVIKKTLKGTVNLKAMDQETNPETDEFLEILHSVKVK